MYCTNHDIRHFIKYRVYWFNSISTCIIPNSLISTAPIECFLFFPPTISTRLGYGLVKVHVLRVLLQHIWCTRLGYDWKSLERSWVHVWKGVPPWASDRCKTLFPTPPLLAYRRNSNLNDMLVSRRFPNNTNIIQTSENIDIDRNSNTCEECGRVFSTPRGKLIHISLAHKKQTQDTQVGFHRCGDKRWNTCKLGIFGTRINITKTCNTFNIKQGMTCKSTNVIYCVTCKKCWAQYIGETEQELHARQRGHLADIKSNKSGVPYVDHFRGCGAEHYTITGVEKLRNRDPQIRKAREKYYKSLFDVQIKWRLCGKGTI